MEPLGRLGEAWEALGASKLILGPPLGGFGRLWETLGEALGRLWGDFVRLRGALGDVGESLGSLWEALGKLWESFRAFLLLAPSLPPLYINILQTPDQPL